MEHRIWSEDPILNADLERIAASDGIEWEKFKNRPLKSKEIKLDSR